jgi:DNA-binding winged helix-turn-helix (wHTH) protein/tetratricopeptide (TPR) repeat protein
VTLRFGPFHLDGSVPELRRDGVAVRVEPMVLDLLVYLAENRDRIISKDDLVESVWKGRIVSDAAITSRINLVREAVGDSGRVQAVIQTVPKRGFRFVADVEDTETRVPDAPVGKIEAGASILVLPFRDLTPGPSAFLAEGLTDDLILALTRHHDVRVMSFRTSMEIENRAAPERAARDGISADYVISGTVQVRGQRVRVSVSLVDRITGANVHAERFDREVSDGFDLQDEIVRALAGCLPWRVLEHTARRVSGQDAGHLPSYQAFFRAGFEASHSDDIAREEADYRAILVADPTFGPAHAALGFVLGYKVFMTGQQTPDDVDASLDHARTALRHAPGNERVIAKCAMAFQFAGQFPVARRLIDQAMRINPYSTDCTHFYATILGASGEAEKGLEVHRQTMSLDPLFPEEHFEGMIETLFLLKEFDDAISMLERWSNPPRHVLAFGAACAALAGDTPKAADYMRRFEGTEPEGFSNETFVSAMLRYHKRASDRDHWLSGFKAAGMQGIAALRSSGPT